MHKPNPYMMTGKQKVLMARPRQRRKKRHFRWSFVTIPFALVLSYWFLCHIKPTLSFNAWMDLFGLVGEARERYRQLAILCIIGISTCLLVRWWRKTPKP